MIKIKIYSLSCFMPRLKLPKCCMLLLKFSACNFKIFLNIPPHSFYILNIVLNCFRFRLINIQFIFQCKELYLGVITCFNFIFNPCIPYSFFLHQNHNMPDFYVYSTYNSIICIILLISHVIFCIYYFQNLYLSILLQYSYEIF